MFQQPPKGLEQKTERRRRLARTVMSIGWVFFIVALSRPAASQVLISEVVASNVGSLTDIDGDAPDWIELYNAGTEAVFLDGFGLSDDAAEPYKWVFPNVAIGPSEFLVLFASGKDRKTAVTDWDTVVDGGENWRYLAGDQEPPSDWAEVDFDDAQWPSGPSGFGFGDGDDATVVEADTVYVRKRFDLDADTVAELQGGFLHVDFDDGFVAYLNDVEIARAGFGGWQRLRPQHDRPALLDAEAQLYQGGTLGSRWIDSLVDLARVGTNLLAVQVHNGRNRDGADDDLSLTPILTLGVRTADRDGNLSDLVEVSPVRLHTNFKLSSSGETVTLTDPFGVQVDQLTFDTTPVDMSTGPISIDDRSVVFFEQPTPLQPNSVNHRPGFSLVPTLTAGGFYPSGIEVTVTSAPGTWVRYTLDGSEPRFDSEPYTGPLAIDQQPQVIRARAFEPGLWPSPIATATFFLDEAPQLPVVSIVMDPDDLFDPETGIYAFGDSYNPEWPHKGANFWQDWERPAHLELWEPGGGPGFTIDAGIKIHGGGSRANDQRSLRLITRGGYGESPLEYPIFEGYDVEEFERLVLRNSGQDWRRSHLRDALVHTLVAPTGLDVLAYRPVLALVNGQYWGIYNFRERADRFYVESHDGEDEIDLLESWGLAIEGDGADYAEMIDFVRQNELANEENYAWVAERMDTDQYAAYLAAEVFADTRDWPDNNIKFWRPRQGGRWQWLLFDTDSGVGSVNPPSEDSLERLLGEASSLPEWSTDLARGLMEQPEFQTDFLNFYADYLNTWFSSSVTRATLRELVAQIEPYIGRHQSRWGGTYGGWQEEIERIDRWLERRPENALDHLLQQFGLRGTYELTLGVEPAGTGSVRLTGITVDEEFTGTYFSGVPVTLNAEAAPGYRFVGWSDRALPAEDSIEILPDGDSYTVGALFEELPPPSSPVVIHEINYNSAADFDPDDWVELFNSGPEEIDLTGWSLRDDDDTNVYNFPAGTRIPAAGYLVVCTDLAAFQVLFPEIDAMGDLGFGLGGGGDSVRLFELEGDLHDLVVYDDELPWPLSPDGEGPSLELIHPALDNSLPDSWASSAAAHGTPGGANGGD